MRTIRISAPGLSLAAALALVLTGCNRQQEPASPSVQNHGKHAKAASPAGQPPDPNRAWCGEHETYEDICFICNPKLREKGRLWCGEHGRYEDRCWLCHPDEEEKTRTYCSKHFLYQDECFLCRPELKKAGKPAGQARVLQCQEHGVAEQDCAICHPDLAAGLQPGQGLKVRLPSAESAQIAGVEVGIPSTRAVSGGVECYAELTFNQNQLAEIAAPVSGVIQAVAADLGSKVEENQVVAQIWSAEIAGAVAKAVLTQQTLERETKLRAQRVTSERDLQEAQAAHRAAWQHLRTLGFSQKQLDLLNQKPEESVFLEVRAPFAGEIIARSAVRGALVEAGKPLFTLVDRSVMWATLSMPESVLHQVEPGQKVELTVEALSGQTFEGTLTWVGPEVDDRTRLAQAKAEVPNPKGQLRARMFARARILTRGGKEGLWVPAAAVQQVDGKPFVFIKAAEDLFEARSVRLGTRRNDGVEVLEGLQPTDSLVVNHSYALKSQFLMSRLGAGCVDD